MDFPFAGAKVHWTFARFRLTHGHLRALATIPGEKCRLAVTLRA